MSRFGAKEVTLNLSQTRQAPDNKTMRKIEEGTTSWGGNVTGTVGRTCRIVARMSETSSR